MRKAASYIDVDRSMTAVTELLLAMPSAQLSDHAAKARGKAYIAALGDLPSFAVIEACRRWLRADAGLLSDGKEPRKPNYAFAPSAPELRMVAEPIARVVEYQAAQLESLLGAMVVADQVAPEFSDQHRADMQDRLERIGLSTKPPARKYNHDTD